VERSDAQEELRELKALIEELRAEIDALAASRSQEINESLTDAKRELEVQQSQLADLARQLESAETRSAEQLSIMRQSEQRALAEANATWSQYDTLRSRRSVRLALSMARIAAPVFRLARSSKEGQGASDVANKEAPVHEDEPSGPTLDDEASLTAEIRHRRPGSERTDGPMVSILVLTRDGAEHLSNLLTRLEGTLYRAFEVVIVDNGSSDTTNEVLAIQRTYPLSAIRNDGNVSFSAGNNQAAEVASGEYLLFLNNDIEPISPGWLGALVDAIETGDDVVAAGAVLVYPIRDDPQSDLTVQHRCIELGFKNGAIHAFNVGANDPLDEAFSGIVDVPAATAAALLVRAGVFSDVGGFSEGYVYGTEDVDLCLRLKEVGRIVVTGDALLYHYESATQSAIGWQISRINRMGNWQQFVEHWAPRATRSVLRDRLTGRGRWVDRRERIVAITLSRDDPSKGFGDYYTAHELGDAFADAGWRVIYAERHEDRWYNLHDDVDLLISLLEFYDVRRAPHGAVTIAWVRNWVDRWLEQAWFEDYDVVAVSSYMGTEAIANKSRFRPVTIPLASNPARFNPGATSPTFESDYVYTGNNWGLGRVAVEIVDVHPGERFMVFGKGWESERSLTRYWRGGIDYDLLPAVYRSTKVVLDDSSVHTLPHAFMNSRVFDALACGALVITNNVQGSQELFGGLLPTYTNRAELRALLDDYLSNDDARDNLVARLRHKVLNEYSYENRAREFVEITLAHIEQPHAAIKISVPDEAAKEESFDFRIADALAAELIEQGLQTDIHLPTEWDLPAHQATDIVINIRAERGYVPKPAHLNVLWIVNPQNVSRSECAEYDLILVASRSLASYLRSQTQTPVEFVPIAADARKFYRNGPGGEFSHDVLFVGEDDGSFPITVHGTDEADQSVASALTGGQLSSQDLGRLYASAKVVVNNHGSKAREDGFVSNRIFEALACGQVVVSDPVVGLDELFGGLVPTYSDSEELESAVRKFLTDDEYRESVATSAAALVTDRHTFAQRAEEIVRLMRPLLAQRSKDLESNRFGG
jgi:O-antigen biosynthesis protein